MFGLKRSTGTRVYTWRDIPNEIVATRARESSWSIGKIRLAVTRESLAIIVNLAKELKCKTEEVKCERCDFPLITPDQLKNNVIVTVERIEPNGYVVHSADRECGKRTEMVRTPPRIISSTKGTKQEPS